MPTGGGFATATLNFLFVEMRPMFLMYTAMESLSLNVVKDQYLYRYAEDVPDCKCPVSQTNGEFEFLLLKALHTFDLHFEDTTECTEVSFPGTNYGAFVHGIVYWMFVALCLVNVGHYLVAAFKGGDKWNWSGGEYVHYTLVREERILFKISLYVFLGTCVAAAIACVIFIIICATEVNDDPLDVLKLFLLGNFVDIALFVWGGHNLTASYSLDAFNSWNLQTFKQVQFNRPTHNLFWRGSNRLYRNLVTMTDADLSPFFEGGMEGDNGKMFQRAREEGVDSAMVDSARAPLVPKS